MKKLISAILMVSFVLLLCGCQKTGDKTGLHSSIDVVSSQDETESIKYDKELYIDVDPADLTDEQARVMMKVFIDKQFELFFLFTDYNDEALDYTQVCSFDEKYVLLKDERFTCVQDIRDYVLEVMTEEAAKRIYFDNYLDGPYDLSQGATNRYIDYEGKLYCSTHSGGKGFNRKLLPETSHIVERTENSVKIEMKTLFGYDTDDGWIYTPVLVKTKDGWRIDSDLDDGYYSDLN